MNPSFYYKHSTMKEGLVGLGRLHPQLTGSSWPNTMICNLTFFRALEKKEFPFFPVGTGGNPVQKRPQNPALCKVPFLLERVDLKSQKEGILGKKIAWGKGGVDRAKKRKK